MSSINYFRDPITGKEKTTVIITDNDSMGLCRDEEWIEDLRRKGAEIIDRRSDKGKVRRDRV